MGIRGEVGGAHKRVVLKLLVSKLAVPKLLAFKFVAPAIGVGGAPESCMHGAVLCAPLGAFINFSIFIVPVSLCLYSGW